MKRLHEALNKRVGWYKNYHSKPSHVIINWSVLLLVGGLFLVVVILSSRSNPLFSQAGFLTNPNKNLVSILGDGGMLDSGARVVLYLPNSGQRYGDCLEAASPNGLGPNGNLITEEDNARTDWPENELNMANKCAKPAAGSSSLNWYHWGAELGTGGDPNAKVSVDHQWSQKDAQGNYITGFSGKWLPERGPLANSGYRLTINTQNIGGAARRTWSSTLTTGVSGYNNLIMFAPVATDYRQILFERWLSGPSVVWQAWVKLNESFSGEVGNGYRFAAPELEGCWKVDGSSCDGASSSGPNNVVRFLSFDLNPNRIDVCTITNTTNCPPYHLSDTGEKISKTDLAQYPFDAYYFWCGPSVDANVKPEERCPQYGAGGQEIIQLAPSPIWAKFGAPSSPLRLNQDTLLRIQIGAVAERIYKAASVYPKTLRFNKIYVGPEMFTSQATVSWKTAGFDVLVPGRNIPQSQDTVPPQISEIKAVSVTGNQAVVTWLTNELTTGLIQYLANSDEKTASMSKQDTRSLLRHTLVVPGLSPNTTYTYRIIALDAAGNKTISELQTFTTVKSVTPETIK
jgi:hypothetical protein